MKTTSFLIITALVWVIVLFKRGALTSALPATYRLPLVTLSFVLLWAGAYPVLLLIWGLFHPSSFLTTFYTRSGIFPPLACVGVTALACVAGCVQYYIGFRLVEQKRAAYLWGARAAPYLFVVAAFEYSLRLQKHLRGTNRDYYLFVVGILLLGGAYLWLYKFCMSSRNQELLNRSTAPTAPPNAGSAGIGELSISSA